MPLIVLGEPPCVLAAREGHTAALTTLLDRGAHINIDSAEGIALHFAIRSGHTDAFNLLLNRGADVHARDDKGDTPLHEAACANNVRTLTALLNRGADINATNHREQTVLHASFMKNGHLSNASVPILLLGKGVDVNARDHTGKTALHVAASPFYSARGTGVLASLVTLLDRGVHVNARDHTGQTALHVAAGNTYKRDAGVLNLLLNRGADIHATDHSGQTAVHVAARAGHTAALEVLIPPLISDGSLNRLIRERVTADHDITGKALAIVAQNGGEGAVAELLVAALAQQE